MTRTVDEIMTREVHTLREDQVLVDALTFLHEHHVRHVPIVNGQGRVVGVLTDRDVKRATPTALVPSQREVWQDLVHTTSLAQIMSKDPFIVAPKAPLADAVRLFVEEKIGCLPVVDGAGGASRLVGIVTAQDLLEATLEMLAE